MKKRLGFDIIFPAVYYFMIFFLIVAFLITCTVMLFVSVMTWTLDITLTNEAIEAAAKLTFLNVIILSLLFTVLDYLRRRFTVDRPAKRITDAAERIMAGDFSVRIPVSRSQSPQDRLGEIAVCFNKMAEELSGTQTLRDDFIANVSHELKTPLAVIQNYAKMLENKELSDEAREEYARSITSACGRLSSLVTNILRLNKLENQQFSAATEVFDLSEQVCTSLLSFEEVWEKKGLNIETDIEDNVTVRSDSEMLSLVWSNLFSNAIKFTEQGGTVYLEIKSDCNYAVVKIRDTGCGISPEVGKHMFEKFYQGDTSHSALGNGLGLALVKRIIDITGSDISVESELGRGSTFTVKIPRNQDSSDKPE